MGFRSKVACTVMYALRRADQKAGTNRLNPAGRLETFRRTAIGESIVPRAETSSTSKSSGIKSCNSVLSTFSSVGLV